MNREEITALVVEARLTKGLSWQELAEALQAPLVWSTAALLGQHPLSPEQAATAVDLLGLPERAVPILTAVPYRGPGVAAVPTDPTMYRFHEALMVYGPALKELIHEEFGDGIMSAINFKLDFGRDEHDGAAHVVVRFDGKFLPYAWPTD